MALLDDAWTAPVPPVDEAWRTLPDTEETSADFAGWREVIRQQMRDLREMEEAGSPEDDCGVEAPRGDRWYNFDPAGYLEAAVAGTFGGWQADDAKRLIVTAPAAIAGGDGTIPLPAPSAETNPVQRIDGIPWTVFTDFLDSGRMYE